MNNGFVAAGTGGRKKKRIAFDNIDAIVDILKQRLIHQRSLLSVHGDLPINNCALVDGPYIFDQLPLQVTRSANCGDVTASALRTTAHNLWRLSVVSRYLNFMNVESRVYAALQLFKSFTRIHSADNIGYAP